MNQRQQNTKIDMSKGYGPLGGSLVGVLLCAVIVALDGALEQAHLYFPKVWPGVVWWAPLFFNGVCLLSSVARDTFRRLPRRNVVFRATCWAVPALWTSWVITFGMSMVVFVLGATFAAAAGICATFLGRYIPPGQEAAVAAGQPVVHQLPSPRLPLEEQIRQQIAGLLSLREPAMWPLVSQREAWPRDAGYTFEIEGVPGRPLNWKKLAGICEDLAAEMKLAHGCNPRARMGSHRGSTYLDLPTKNFNADNIPYPSSDGYGPLTVRKPFPVGGDPRGQYQRVCLHQGMALVAGQRGGGKTVLMHNLTASLARCTDVLIWHIDLNGGRLSRSWLYPYANGQVTEPVVDWTAYTVDEAMLMAEAAIRIAEERDMRYAHLLSGANTDVLPVSNKIPMIIIMVDEGYEIAGEDVTPEQLKLSKKLMEVARKGRAMCVNLVWSSQRTTGDYMPSQIKRGAQAIFCTRVADNDELQNVFGWHRGASLDDLIFEGQMLVRVGGASELNVFKGFNIPFNQRAEVAIAVQSIRRAVRLDPISVVAGDRRGDREVDQGGAYSKRWQRPVAGRYLSYLKAGGGGENDDEFNIAEMDTNATPTNPASSTSTAPAAATPKTGGSKLDELQAYVDQVEKQQSTPTPPTSPTSTSGDPINQVLAMPDNKVADVFDDLMRNAPVYDPRNTQPSAAAAPAPTSAPPSPPAEPSDDGDLSSRQIRQAFILQLLNTAGITGATTKEIVDKAVAGGLASATRPQLISEDLKRLREANQVTQWKGGRHFTGKSGGGRWWTAQFGDPPRQQ